MFYLCRSKLKWYNWASLAVNAVFHILHLVQSHWTYDGISQDVSLSSSQVTFNIIEAFYNLKILS